MSSLAIVAIGRNEGERLGACLATLVATGFPVVYIDSGSTDGSPNLARDRGVVVVSLDPSSPFTAARARNEGLTQALALHPDLSLVQFVDGDCQLDPAWLAEGERILRADERIAVTCGRVRELRREATIYNRLCDMEWRAPPGEASTCGGNALFRVRALREVGGFDGRLIGGEEPELCLRLRQRGWRVWRSPAPMALHDANMTRFGQWWMRSLRSGWCYAEGASIHATDPARPWSAENRSILLWGAILPFLAVALAWPSAGLSLLLASVAFVTLAFRVQARGQREGLPSRDAWLRAAFLVVGKVPQAIGQVQFRLRRRRRVIDWREQ